MESTPLQSMKAADAAAPFLFNFEELSAEKLEGVGEFTGERLLARRPDAYQAIIRMSAEGLSISAQARALGVSRNTVCAVRDREGFSIEQDKKDLLRDVRRAARLSVERAIELVPGIQSAKDAAIVAAVMVDKMQLLSGEATARVERVEVSQDKLSEMLASLPVLEAEVVPVTGPHGSGSGQKGLPGVGAESGSGCQPEPVSDTESEGFDYVGGLQVATLDATSAVEPVEADARRVDQEGGRGSGFLDTPPMTPTDLGEQKIFGKGVSSSQEPADELLTN
jgi:hypothetical protein